MMDIDEIENCPAVVIPCEDLEALQWVVTRLFETKILTDDDTFKLKNVPEDINDILNDPDYFKPVNVLGFHTIKGKVRGLEQNTEELL